MEWIHNFFHFFGEHKDGFKALREFALILFGLAGFYFLWLRTKSLKKSADASEKQAELAEIGQITERYIKAVDQLGSDKLEIRLGGIYGLEKVAKLSQDLRKQVFEVLTAFIRENAKLSDSLLKEDYMPRIDIQAVITVLGRRETLKTNDNLDLSNSLLVEYEFKGDFVQTNFSNSNCDYAIFSGSNCAYASFNDASCDRAEFIFTNLYKASLTGSIANNANFSTANLDDSNFDNAELTSTIFNQTVIKNSDFNGANLTKAFFDIAKIRKTYFIDAICEKVIFRSVEFTDTDFRRADLEGAMFETSKHDNSNFEDANLENASGVIIEQINGKR